MLILWVEGWEESTLFLFFSFLLEMGWSYVWVLSLWLLLCMSSLELIYHMLYGELLGCDSGSSFWKWRIVLTSL